MENYKSVLPADLNQFGYLYGGSLLKWVDEYAWIAASLEFPGCRFVTVGMDKVEFRKSVRAGTILRFAIDRLRAGTTSVSYQVNVNATELETGHEENIFSTTITFVCLDNEGKKKPLSSGRADQGS